MAFARGPVPLRGGKLQFLKTAWGKHIRQAAVDSYNRACPHDTTRQMRAHALGLNTLVSLPSGSAETDTEQEVET